MKAIKKYIAITNGHVVKSRPRVKQIYGTHV